MKKGAISKIGNKNPQWKGDKISYKGLHDWMRKHLKMPKRCQLCKKQKRLDMANISQEYIRIFSDWEWLCRKCHMKKDGRLEKLILRNKSKRNKICQGERHKSLTLIN